MNLRIYAIRDTKIDAFSQPFYSHTDGSALRAFADHVNEAGSPANKHPDDYQLYRIGAFNDQTGTISGEEPACIGSATEYHGKN